MERVRSKRWRVISSDESRPRSSLQIYLPPARPAGTGSSSAAACAWARMQIRIETQLPWLASGMVPPIQSAYQSVHASLQDSNARQGSANCLDFRPSKGKIALKRNLGLWKKLKRNFREHVRIRAKSLQSGRREDTGGVLYRDDGEVGGGRFGFSGHHDGMGQGYATRSCIGRAAFDGSPPERPVVFGGPRKSTQDNV